MINRSRLQAVIVAGAAGALLGRAPVDGERAIVISEDKLDAQRREADRTRQAERERLQSIKAARASAAINRWTGKPHEHNRAKARQLKRTAA